MATVTELSEPYSNILVTPLAAGPSVCTVCRTAVEGTYPRCYACNQARTVARLGLADAVVPVSVAVRGEQFAFDLRRYKDDNDPFTRRVLKLRLAAVLWRFLVGHEACVAGAAGVDGFGIVTTVPSSGRRNGVHPLREIVASIVEPTRARHADLLGANPTLPPDRNVHADRFFVAPDADLSGVPVLLIDDTWTTGGRAQSAAWALKQAGAPRVGVVVLGRWFEPNYAPTQRYLSQARRIRFDWDVCCVHARDSDRARGAGTVLRWKLNAE